MKNILNVLLSYSTLSSNNPLHRCFTNFFDNAFSLRKSIKPYKTLSCCLAVSDA